MHHQAKTAARPGVHHAPRPQTAAPMKHLHIIGIGSGHPEHLTLQAVRAMQSVDVFFLPYKGEDKRELHRLRKELCEEVIPHHRYRTVDFRMPVRTAGATDYAASVAAWHRELDAVYAALIASELGEGQTGAFLVWGDPALYDGTIRVLTAIRDRGGDFEYQVIPGISSLQALAAAHKTPLNRIGESILITPGRTLPSPLPDAIDNLVVMLDGQDHLARLAGQDLEIRWGANLGTSGEVLLQGPLDQVLPQIRAARSRLRAEQGWVMDTSLIRRIRPPRS